MAAVESALSTLAQKGYELINGAIPNSIIYIILAYALIYMYQIIKLLIKGVKAKEDD